MTIDFGFSYREPHRFSNPRAILHNPMLDVSHSLAPALKPPHHRPVDFTLGRFWFGVRSARMYEQVRLTPNSSTLSTVRRVCGIGRAVLTRMPGIPRRSLSGRIMRRRLSFRSLLLAVLKARVDQLRFHVELLYFLSPIVPIQSSICFLSNYHSFLFVRFSD